MESSSYSASSRISRGTVAGRAEGWGLVSHERGRSERGASNASDQLRNSLRNKKKKAESSSAIFAFFAFHISSGIAGAPAATEAASRTRVPKRGPGDAGGLGAPTACLPIAVVVIAVVVIDAGAASSSPRAAAHRGGRRREA